jgi:hypothetical protein
VLVGAFFLPPPSSHGAGSARWGEPAAATYGGPGDDARMNYAARVLLFPDRATFAFLANIVAINPGSVGAAAEALLPELSTDVVRISR